MSKITSMLFLLMIGFILGYLVGEVTNDELYADHFDRYELFTFEEEYAQRDTES